MIILLIFIRIYLHFITELTMKLISIIVGFSLALLPHETDYRIHGLIALKMT